MKACVQYQWCPRVGLMQIDPHDSPCLLMTAMLMPEECHRLLRIESFQSLLEKFKLCPSIC